MENVHKVGGSPLFWTSFIPLFILSGAAVRHQDGEFSVKFDDKANFVVSVHGEAWLTSAPAFFHLQGRAYNTSGADVNMTNRLQTGGTDNLGYYQETVFTFQPIQPSGLDNKLHLSFKYYSARPFIILKQAFEGKWTGTSVGDRDRVTTGFPNVRLDGSQGLGYMAYGGYMVGDTQRRAGLWNRNIAAQSGDDSGPLALFNKKGDSLFISSFTNPMAGSVVYDQQGGVASWGLLGNASMIPDGFSYSVIIHYSDKGIRQNIEDWGLLMRTYYQRTEAYRKSDMSNNYLGFWTDNGAYYYYNTEEKSNYADTMVAVKNYADKLKLPYKYIQYDSWWYPKGPAQGVTEWISMPEVFPNGLYDVYNKTGLPVVAHNRWWSDKTNYAKQNGGKYDFIVEEDTLHAIPVSQDFWNFLMSSSKQWGLITYEQDWLNNEFDKMLITSSDLEMGRRWLMQMGHGAAQAGLTIQYCMAPTRHVLQALQIPVVSQIRVTDDYQPGNNNWKIGISSMLADAVGLAPFKDNFWSTTQQPGNIYNASEPYPALNALVSTLSTGPVGPSDKIGHSNASLIMRSCNAEGLLLKPSRPARAIDAQIIQWAFQDNSGPAGEVYTTHSEISGFMFGVVLAADLNNSFTLTPSAAGWPTMMRSKLFPYNPSSAGQIVDFSDKAPLYLKGCTKADFCLYYTTPVMVIYGGKDLYILGELTKWVPMSPQRVTEMIKTSSDAILKLSGASGEEVEITYVLDGDWTTVKCVLSDWGQASLSIVNKTCR